MADAQLAILAKHGHVWAAATIDSDFIIHGIERVFLGLLGVQVVLRFGGGPLPKAATFGLTRMPTKPRF